MTPERHQQLHDQARAVHVRRWYRPVRWVLAPILRVYFRVRILYYADIPLEGATILAANHASFTDSFFIALSTQRPMRWMAKSELFHRRWAAFLLIRVGAFPVLRGQSDTVAHETAQWVLKEGGILALFPEGTRHREGLGQPKRGVGRLALETGATVVPIAIDGTQRLWKGPLLVPRRVVVAVGEPVTVVETAPTPEQAEEVVQQVWPKIQRLHEQAASHPKALAAIGAAVAGVLGGSVLLKKKTRKQK